MSEQTPIGDRGHDGYFGVGWYNLTEAKRLLAQLDGSPIRFRVKTPFNDPEIGDPVATIDAGAFGAANRILISIHEDDQKLFQEIHDPIFSPSPTGTSLPNSPACAENPK